MSKNKIILDLCGGIFCGKTAVKEIGIYRTVQFIKIVPKQKATFTVAFCFDKRIEVYVKHKKFKNQKLLLG